jgi:hypothetical protein
MSSGPVTLGDIADKITMLEVACSRCGRFGRLRVSRLIEQHGADAKLPALREILAGDCPRVGATSIYERCGVRYPQLPRVLGAHFLDYRAGGLGGTDPAGAAAAGEGDRSNSWRFS